MKTQNNHKQKAKDINPVSRKTNEEIDEDEAGNLIIGGRISKNNQLGEADGLGTENHPKGENSLIDNENQPED